MPVIAPLTKEQAQAIVDAHEIDRIFSDEYGEEATMLEEQNPELHEAYKALLLIANH